MDRARYSRSSLRSTRFDRACRAANAALSAAAVLVIVWRVARLLIGKPDDAAIILGCVAVLATAWMDVRTARMEGKRDE